MGQTLHSLLYRLLHFTCIFIVLDGYLPVYLCMHIYGASQAVLVLENPPASAGIRDMGSIPGSGRSLGEGDDNPLQYSCLENAHGEGYSPWDHKGSDTTERISIAQSSKIQDTG